MRAGTTWSARPSPRNAAARSHRTSANGGATWTAAVKISDATSGAAYKSASGFLDVYGDYGEIAINSVGKTIAVWGEGTSYTGPGGVWFNRQP